MPSQVRTAQGYAEILVGGSDGGWTGAADVLSAIDTDYAIGPAISVNGHNTDHLVANDFGFSLPANSTVLGLQVRFIRGINQNLALPRDVELVDDSITPSLDSATLSGGTVDNEPTPYEIGVTQEFTKGGASSDWGLSLTETEVNDALFGFAFKVHCNVSGGFIGEPAFDFVEVTAFYTTTGDPPPPPPPPPPPTLGVGRIDNSFRRIPESPVRDT